MWFFFFFLIHGSTRSVFLNFQILGALLDSLLLISSFCWGQRIDSMRLQSLEVDWDLLCGLTYGPSWWMLCGPLWISCGGKIFSKLCCVYHPRYHWCSLIFLPISAELNAKGAILYAFEMFRLKSCVDFKPYEGERSYIIFQQFDGSVWKLYTVTIIHLLVYKKQHVSFKG